MNCYGYARGYYDGRALGTEQCPFSDDSMIASYRDGYEAGVADYCEEAHPEDIATDESRSYGPQGAPR